MKRFSTGLLFAFLILVTTTLAAAGQPTIKLIVNGKEVQSDVPPQIIDGRTMIPARFLAEELGAKVDWDDPNSSVIITSPYKLLKVNGEQTTWPYWFENGHLYLEYRNAIELLRICHPASSWNVGFAKDSDRLIVNNAVFTVPTINKGEFKAISITFLEFNRNLIKFDFDPAAGNLTLLPF